MVSWQDYNLLPYKWSLWRAWLSWRNPWKTIVSTVLKPRKKPRPTNGIPRMWSRRVPAKRFKSTSHELIWRRTRRSSRWNQQSRVEHIIIFEYYSDVGVLNNGTSWRQIKSAGGSYHRRGSYDTKQQLANSKWERRRKIQEVLTNNNISWNTTVKLKDNARRPSQFHSNSRITFKSMKSLIYERRK